MNKPPKLALPVVEDDVLPDTGKGGVGRVSSSPLCLTEPFVEDRPRRPKTAESVRTGDELPDGPELLEFMREISSLTWLGDGRGEVSPFLS